jgi:hypothetical protein
MHTPLADDFARLEGGTSKPKRARRKDRAIGDGGSNVPCPTSAARKCPLCGYVAAGKGKHVHAGKSIRMARADAEHRLREHREREHGQVRHDVAH